MNEPKLIVASRRPALLSGFDNAVDILVRVEAPSAPSEQEKRMPLSLAIVIDRSGSMSGQPLEEAKKCAAMIVDRLAAGDHLAIVTYDDSVQIIASAAPAENKESLKRAIAAIESGGSTNLHGGWLKGAELIAGSARPDVVSRVLLLSDGCANAGVTDVDQIAQQTRELAQAGVTTSTYGLGRGFNEDLMIAMANAGQGNAYYGETADVLIERFAEEFDLLSALCARAVDLHVGFEPPATAGVLNRYVAGADGVFRLPDLAHDGEVWAVVRVKLPGDAAGNGDGVTPIPVATIGVRFRNIEGVEHSIAPLKIALLSLPANAWHAVAENDLVLRRVRELEAANIQDRAQKAARQGDWATVRRALGEARANAADNEWLEEVVNKLEVLAAREDRDMFSKETAFASRQMRSRMASSVEADSSDLEAAKNAPAYARRKREQGKRDPD